MAQTAQTRFMKTAEKARLLRCAGGGPFVCSKKTRALGPGVVIKNSKGTRKNTGNAAFYRKFYPAAALFARELCGTAIIDTFHPGPLSGFFQGIGQEWRPPHR